MKIDYCSFPSEYFITLKRCVALGQTKRRFRFIYTQRVLLELEKKANRFSYLGGARNFVTFLFKYEMVRVISIIPNFIRFFLALVLVFNIFYFFSKFR